MGCLAEDFVIEQERIDRCIQNGLSIGVSGIFYVAMARDLATRAKQAAMSNDVVEMIKVFEEMKEFKE